MANAQQTDVPSLSLSTGQTTRSRQVPGARTRRFTLPPRHMFAHGNAMLIHSNTVFLLLFTGREEMVRGRRRWCGWDSSNENFHLHGAARFGSRLRFLIWRGISVFLWKFFRWIFLNREISETRAFCIQWTGMRGALVIFVSL